MYSTACPDWEEKIVAGESIIPPPIFPETAQKGLDIFKSLRVPDLPGKPTFEDVSAQWVFDFVASIFGAYDASTGEQLIKEFFLLISKKNGKSSLASAIMLTAFILCWREEEEHLILAPTKEVADAAFNPAAGMIRADDELSAIFNVQDYIKTITHRVNHNSLKIVAADSKTATGKKAGRILIDEIHEFGKMGKANNIFLEATGGMVSRPEGFVIYLSSQSEEPPAGIFKEKLDYFRNVRDGIIEDKKVLPVLYEYPKEYLDKKLYLVPENFHITNPNIGRSVSQSWLEDNLKKAQHGSDGSLQQFLAKHLNVEIGLALRNDRWAGVEFWEDAQADITLDDLIDRSEVVTVGIDGGGLDDMLAVYVLGREQGTGTWLGWGQAWIHPIAIERRKENESLYRDFAQQGDLVIVDKVGDDAEQVADVVERVFDAHLLDTVGCDPVGIGDILDRLEYREIPNEQIAGVSQGWRLGGAIKTAERRLADGGLKPARQGLMAWCVSNARIEDRANGILITKAASGKGKIDPVMAMLNAVFLMMANPDAKNKKLILASATRRG